MPPARRCPSKGTRTPLPPCNECPPRALGPVSARRGALEPSSEHVASEKLANGQRRGSPRGLTHASRPTLPIERHTDAPPPHATRALPGCSAPRLGSSRSPQALERACCLGKNVPVANVAAHPGGSPMPPARRCPSKGTRMPLPPMQRVPYPGARPPVSARRGALKPSSEHVASEKTCQWPTSRLTPGAHPCPPLDVAHRKAHGCPSPPCNECPPRALGPVPAHRGALKPSSEHVASERSQTHRRHAYIGPTKASLVAPVCWSGVASGRVAVRRVMPCRSEPDGV